MHVLLAIGLGLILAAVLVRAFEKSRIYSPPRYPHGFEPPEKYGLQLEEVWITAADGVRLNAWFLPQTASAKVLLWFHGNGENIGDGLERLKILARLGINVLALDYRGYGKSEGSPQEAGLYRDADAAYRYLVEERRFQPANIFLFGQSLGGAVAIDLALRQSCGGLIVQGAFTSIRAMARRMFRIPFFEYIPRSSFDSLAKIARVRAPILIIHGTQDEVVPFAMGQALFAAAPEPKSLLPIEAAGHNDIMQVGGQRYLDCLLKFVDGKADCSGP